MKKILLSSLIIFSLFISSTSFIWALTLDTIGSSATTNGTPGTEWWYSSENPVLSGTAGANSSVVVSVNGVDSTVTATSTGTWSFTPTTLTSGDHPVTITGDGQTLSFTLHAGQTIPDSVTKGGQTASSSSQTLPVSGSMETTFLLLALGSVLVLGGWKLSHQFSQ